MCFTLTALISPTFINAQIKINDYSMVGKIIAGNKFCTASLVSANQIVTAAHCLFNQKTRHYISPRHIHFRINNQKSNSIIQSKVKTYTVGLNEIPTKGFKEGFLYGDWAVVTLEKNIGCQKNMLKYNKKTIPHKLTVTKYNNASQQHLDIIDSCLLALPFNKNKTMRLKNCPITHGSSGAPVMQITKTAVNIIGVVSAGANDSKGRYRVIAVPYQAFKNQINHNKCPK